MSIYLDSCAIQRPLDTYSHTRIVLEAEAVLGILALCTAGKLELVSSEALEYEAEQNSLAVRKEHAKAVLAQARTRAVIDEAVETRAQALIEMGVKPIDALHLALAEASHVDYFCTCDDKLLRKAQQIAGLRVKVVSPVDLIKEVGA
ncbi:MAG: PIN domain-containing protein [Candidatus Bipolaricaulota bacterium]|nr:PIN domain-containing protein [Candidatus Bipolaricaulota bacterium]